MEVQPDCVGEKKIRPYFLVGNLICRAGLHNLSLGPSLLKDNRESYASWDVLFFFGPWCKTLQDGKLTEECVRFIIDCRRAKPNGGGEPVRDKGCLGRDTSLVTCYYSSLV